MEERLSSRRGKYKQGVDADEFRRWREDDAVQVRKAEKEMQFAAKRQQRSGEPLPGMQPFNFADNGGMQLTQEQQREQKILSVGDFGGKKCCCSKS